MGVFAPGQFTAPTSGTEGNEAAYRFRQPGYANTDISVAKNTKIVERIAFHVRFDFFNAFNRAKLNTVDPNLPDGSFGKAKGNTIHAGFSSGPGSVFDRATVRSSPLASKA